MSETNNKRIAKNTVFLYLRMLITMGVGLFTSRLVLQILGVSDYGVYNVMGGIIGMLGYINTLFAGGTSRFLTIALGKGDASNLKKTFSTTVVLCMISALLVLLAGETIGLWFVNNKLNIDASRMEAANWVYQCALISACFSSMQIPYTAAIIAHERMDVYAYMSIFDVAMRLLIVFFLSWLNVDKLILYAILLLIVNLLGIIIYRLFCTLKFSECKFSLFFEKKLTKEIFSYSGWSMVGSLANVLNNYGINILLNIFFGTCVNAARGIASQVSSLVSGFYTNFQTAATPQIYKYYAQENLQGMFNLICNTAKYCSFLLILFIVPITMNTYDLLFIWLGQVPDYTPQFVVLIMFQILIQSIDVPVGKGIMAVGKMKLPMTITASCYLAIFPLSYLFMKLGGGPVVSYYVYVAMAPIILILDLWVLNKYTGFSCMNYIKVVVIPIAKVLLLSYAISFAINHLITLSDWYYVLLKAALSCISVFVVVYVFGLNKATRKQVVSMIISKVAK